MDLSYGIEYTAFREEVQSFISENKDKQPKAGVEPGDPGLLAWQKLLIANGFHSRTIPKSYGGYGAEPDIIKPRIISEEFSKAQIHTGFGGQGISMLTPVLLEMGTEAQKQQFINRLFTARWSGVRGTLSRVLAVTSPA